MREYFCCINEHVKEVEIIYPLQPLLILRGCEQQNRVAWTERDGIISLVRFLSFEYDLLSPAAGHNFLCKGKLPNTFKLEASSSSLTPAFQLLLLLSIS